MSSFISDCVNSDILKCLLNKSPCTCAARNGHLKCLQNARNKGCDWDELTCNEAAKNGHLKCLKWALENHCPFDTETIFMEAARASRMNILKWLKDSEYS